MSVERPFFPGHEPAHVLALAPELPLELEGPPEHLPVERAGEAAVAGEGHDRDRLHLAPLQERDRAHARRRAGDAADQLEHPVGVRAHRLDPGLRTAEPGRGDELHRLRDLPRVADGADPPLQVLDVRHQLADEALLLLDVEGVLELADLGVQLLLGLVGDVLRLADRVEHGLLGEQVLAPLLLEPRHLRRRDVVEVPVDPGPQRHDLLLHRDTARTAAG